MSNEMRSGHRLRTSESKSSEFGVDTEKLVEPIDRSMEPQTEVDLI